MKENTPGPWEWFVEDGDIEIRMGDALKKGDKFEIETATGITTGITDRIYEVLAVAKCKRINRVKYFSKEIKGDSIGYVGTFIADDINKIIY